MKRCPRCDYPNPDSRELCFDCQSPLDGQMLKQVQHDAHLQPTFDSDSGSFTYPEDTLLCKRCFVPAVRDDHETPLCAECRKSLTRYRLPRWVMACCGFFAVTMVFSLCLLPGSLKPALLFEKGRKAEAVRDLPTAVAQYRLVLRHMPKSGIVLGRIGICQCKMQDVAGAVDTLQKLNGAKVTPGLAHEIQEASRNLPGVSVSVSTKRQ